MLGGVAWRAAWWGARAGPWAGVRSGSPCAGCFAVLECENRSGNGPLASRAQQHEEKGTWLGALGAFGAVLIPVSLFYLFFTLRIDESRCQIYLGTLFLNYKTILRLFICVARTRLPARRHTSSRAQIATAPRRTYCAVARIGRGAVWIREGAYRVGQRGRRVRIERADWQAGRQASRQTDRQTGKQTDRQAGRQAGRQAARATACVVS